MSKRDENGIAGMHSASILEAVINAVPALVFYKDMEGRYLGCNDAFVEFVGKAREELIGRTAFEVWERDLAEVYDKADKALFEAGEKQSYEGRVTRADGCIRDVIFQKTMFFAEQEKVSGMVGTMQDITERNELERSLEESRRLFTQAFVANPSLIAVSNPENGRLIDVNKAWLEGLKYKREDVIGKTVFDLGVWVDLADREALLEQLGETGCVRDFDAELRASDGTRLSCLIEIDKIVSEDKNLVLWTASDISRRKEVEKELQEMARTDSLTQLANRHALFEVMERAGGRAKRNHRKIAVMVLDLDGFKRVNDDYGHLVGDALLVEVARCLKSSVRDTDFVARLGGDEFAIILEDVDTPDNVSKVAKSIIENITKTYTVKGFECSVGISIGIAIFDQEPINMEELLQRADKALYQMKNQGKGGYVFY